MNPLVMHDLRFVHNYYRASKETDLDAAFEDGKRRAIKVLSNQVQRIENLTRADYEACFCRTPPAGTPAAGDSLGEPDEAADTGVSDTSGEHRE